MSSYRSHAGRHLLELPIHLLYLFLHASDLCLARLNLALQLFDFKVKHELEFFQLAEQRGHKIEHATSIRLRESKRSENFINVIFFVLKLASWFFFLSSYIFFSFSPIVSSLYFISRLCAAISRSSPLIFC